MKNKKIIILLIILGIIVLISTISIILSRNNNITNNSDISELKTKTYKISSDNLYVNKYEKQYTEYSRLTKVTMTIDIKYYINNGDLYKNDDGNIS